MPVPGLDGAAACPALQVTLCTRSHAAVSQAMPGHSPMRKYRTYYKAYQKQCCQAAQAGHRARRMGSD